MLSPFRFSDRYGVDNIPRDAIAWGNVELSSIASCVLLLAQFHVKSVTYQSLHSVGEMRRANNKLILKRPMS